jgi:hypothetical protein
VTGAPELAFEVLGGAHEPHAAVPTLRLELQVTESLDREVYAITLATQVNLDPARRAYDDATRAELVDLFGEPVRWPATTRSFVWTQVDAMVHSFTGATTFSLRVPCSADMEVAATRYIGALTDGEVPLSLHFTGRVLYPSGDGRLQIVQIPWSTSAQYRLPVAQWQEMMAHHHGDAGFVRLRAETLRALSRHKAARGLPSLDACIEELLTEEART